MSAEAFHRSAPVNDTWYQAAEALKAAARRTVLARRKIVVFFNIKFLPIFSHFIGSSDYLTLNLGYFVSYCKFFFVKNADIGAPQLPSEAPLKQLTARVWLGNSLLEAVG